LDFGESDIREFLRMTLKQVPYWQDGMIYR